MNFPVDFAQSGLLKMLDHTEASLNFSVQNLANNSLSIAYARVIHDVDLLQNPVNDLLNDHDPIDFFQVQLQLLHRHIVLIRVLVRARLLWLELPLDGLLPLSLILLLQLCDLLED